MVAIYTFHADRGDGTRGDDDDGMMGKRGTVQSGIFGFPRCTSNGSNERIALMNMHWVHACSTYIHYTHSKQPHE